MSGSGAWFWGRRRGRWVMAGSGWWRGRPGSGRRRCRRGGKSWRRGRSRWGGRGGRAGGGKKAAEGDRGLVPALLALVEPDERGDPGSPLRWTVKSTRALAAELTAQGHKAGADTVGDLLREQGFSLQTRLKGREARRPRCRYAEWR